MAASFEGKVSPILHFGDLSVSRLLDDLKPQHIFSDYLRLLKGRYIAPAIFSKGEAVFFPGFTHFARFIMVGPFTSSFILS